LSRFFRVSRQGYYKVSRAAAVKAGQENEIVEMVLPIRRLHKFMGGKKLYSRLSPSIHQIAPGMGRDKFFGLLRKRRLLVVRKRKYAVTTQSYHRFHKYTNLVKDKPPKGPHQLWVSDITYLRKGQEFMYLFLITDAYSRKIVGWELSHSLGLSGAIRALRMALSQCADTRNLIHHSDRGFQYCSREYVRILEEKGILISMAEAGNCYENALAERMNGILKQEYSLDEVFGDESAMRRAVKEAVFLYNEQRPHWSLALETPSWVHENVA
jgi:transposase InsO family protein